MGTREERLRTQVRVVQTAFRAEVKRLARAPPSADRDDKLRDLRSRCMALLELVRAELDGTAPWHAGLSVLLWEVEQELARPHGDDRV